MLNRSNILGWWVLYLLIVAPPQDPPNNGGSCGDDDGNEYEELCKMEISSARIFCEYAKNDPDMKNIYGGSLRACILANIPSLCVPYYRGY